MKQIQITLRDGIHIVVRHWPADEARAQVVIVHGLAEHSGRWEHVARFLNGRGLDVHAYDLRGHGLSGGPKLDVADFHDHIADLSEVIDAVRKPGLPLVVYGHSMGGLIATGHAVSQHDQPHAYVLSAPALGATVPAPLRLAVKGLSRVFPKVRLPASITGEQLSSNPAVGEAYFADPLVYLKGTAASGQSFLDAMETIGAKLHSIRRPALVVHGGDDELVPTAVSAPLASVSGVTRKVFPKLRHEIHNEHEQDEVLGYVCDWIDGQLSDGAA